jgi:hypothetical protein
LPSAKIELKTLKIKTQFHTSVNAQHSGGQSQMTRLVQPLDGIFGPRHQFAQLFDVRVQLVAAVLFRLVAALAASTAETRKNLKN